MDLRPYQQSLVERVRAEFGRGARRVLMVSPCGSGKTAVASEVLRRVVERGRQALFLAALDAITEDTHARLIAAGLRAGFVQAGHPVDPDAPVQVCSLDTLHARRHYPPADFLFLDEAHGACAATVRETLAQYPKARLLGGTATPQRGDGQSLGDLFEAMVVGPSVAELTAAGTLVPTVVYSPPAPTPGALADDPADALAKYAPGAAAMVFARDAEHARAVAGRVGDRARVILGDTDRRERRRAREALAAGEPLVLVGCGVFVEGWDSPEVRAVVLARAFGVVGGYLQAIGRGSRPSPATGKSECVVVDLTGCALLHGLPEEPRVWSLTGNAVRRTGEGLKPLARCRSCLAVFHAGPVACPRCGAPTRGTRLPLRATRIERQELQLLNRVPKWRRDEQALEAIARRLRAQGGRFRSEKQIAFVARLMFAKSQGRQPEPRPAGAA